MNPALAVTTSPPLRLPMLERIMRDARSLFPGGSAGLLQLMYPPLGAAVAAQSDFFADPFGRVYRSIPQIWATVLTPDGASRARRVRDVHRGIEGQDERGRGFRALDPETFWWAHATFTWEMFEARRLFYREGLRGLDHDALYAETVAWYGRYGMSMRPVPPTYDAFTAKFERVCRETLELTPAAQRVLDMALAGEWRPPLIHANFKDPLTRSAGRAVVIGCLPVSVRERFGVPFTRADRRQFERTCRVIAGTFELVPPRLHHVTLRTGLRVIGGLTRHERYEPPAR
ncbi:MAG: oxygenase MpaB family protein [Polyangiales bacterium]